MTEVQYQTKLYHLHSNMYGLVVRDENGLYITTLMFRDKQYALIDSVKNELVETEYGN